MQTVPEKLAEIPTKLTGSMIRHFYKERYRKVLKRLSRGKKELPEGDAVARAVILHGYSKHADTPDMQKFRHDLMHHGSCDVFYCDLPYHGLSVPKRTPHLRGKIKNFKRLVEAVYALTLETLARPYARPIPVFLIGYSTGALAVLRFIEENPSLQKCIAGVILIAPPFRLDHNAHELIRKYRSFIEGLARYASYIPYVSDISVGDIGVGDLEDKLEYNKKIDLRSAVELHVATIDAKRDLHKVTIPVYIQHGAKDKTALVTDARDVFNLLNLPPHKKRMIVYEHADHGILDERKSRAKVAEDLIVWMNEIIALKEWESVEYEALANDAIEATSDTYFYLERRILQIKNIISRWWTKLKFWEKKS